MELTCRNLDTTAEPKVYPAPRGERKNSSRSGSGSDQTRSAMGPSWGISGGRELVGHEMADRRLGSYLGSGQ